jgi:hypothetical protein
MALCGGFAKASKEGRLCDYASLGRFLSVSADLCWGVKFKFGNWGWVGESEWYGGFGLWCWGELVMNWIK